VGATNAVAVTATCWLPQPTTAAGVAVTATIVGRLWLRAPLRHAPPLHRTATRAQLLVHCHSTMMMMMVSRHVCCTFHHRGGGITASLPPLPLPLPPPLHSLIGWHFTLLPLLRQPVH
jgi:hypothetical protein